MADPPRYDVVLIGSLANFDLILANALSREGLRCAVVRFPAVEIPDRSTWPTPLKALNFDDVRRYAGPSWFWRFSRRCGCVVSITSVLPSALQAWWLLMPFLPYPPIINIGTGSDLAELSRERTRSGMVCRSLLRRAAVNYIPAYPEIGHALAPLRLANLEPFRYVYWLAPRRAPAARTGPIVFFHPSHLDWGATDRNPDRNSTKGNDRFFRAFFRAAARGADIRCVVLDRGPDRALARELVAQSGYADRFEWLPPLGTAQLHERMAAADVVIDQFDVGGFGGIAIEAMAQGKPVLIHVADDFWPLVYDDAPPVLACRSEDEIHGVILDCTDRARLDVLGDRAARWVDANYRSGAAARRMAFKIAMMTGKGWPLRGEEAAR